MHEHHYWVGTIEDAAALVVAGLRLEGIAREGQRLRFLFARDPRATDIFCRFWAFDLPLDARSLIEAIRRLADLVANADQELT